MSKLKDLKLELEMARENLRDLEKEFDELWDLAYDMARELESITNNIQLTSSGATIATQKLMKRWRGRTE
jgi:hypothetical protein